jgi:hypothetical protein
MYATDRPVLGADVDDILGLSRKRTAAGSFLAQRSVSVKILLACRISGAQNTLNFFIMVGVALPALALGYAICTADPASHAPIHWDHFLPTDMLQLRWWRALGLHSPLTFVNLLFLLNVDVLFWVVALLQGTTWVSTTTPSTLHMMHMRALNA